MFSEPGQEPHGKLVTGHQELVEAGIPAAHHHLGVKAGGQLTDQISVGGPVNTKTHTHTLPIPYITENRNPL